MFFTNQILYLYTVATHTQDESGSFEIFCSLRVTQNVMIFNHSRLKIVFFYKKLSIV